jgi:hypothetical protein
MRWHHAGVRVVEVAEGPEQLSVAHRREAHLLLAKTSYSRQNPEGPSNNGRKTYSRKT